MAAHGALFCARFAFRDCYGYSRYMTRSNPDAVAHLDMSTAEMVADYERASLESSIADLTADDVAVEQWDEWAEGLRRREAVYRHARLRLEALREGVLLPACEHCGSEFAGRSDARFCSTQCRVAAHRARKKTEGQETVAEKKVKAEAELQADKLKTLNKFYEDTGLMAWLARRGEIDVEGRKKVIGWLRNAIEDIEAL